MKKIITLFLITLCVVSVYSNDYVKFPKSNAIWNYLTTGRMGYPYEFLSINSLGDTITLDNKKYIEVYVEQNGYKPIIGYIREDTLTRRIYYRDYYNEVILYDFSLNVGDTIFYGNESGNPESVYYKVVNSIGTIELNGEQRKIWNLTTSMNYMNDIWIEGIGSVYRYGLLNPLKPDIPTDASTTYFGCFKNDNIQYFNREVTNSEDCPCFGWLVNVPEVKSKSEEIILYPIPTKDKLNISIQNLTYDYFEIYTFNSKLIEKIKINSRENIELNLSNLEKGIYFIKFTGKENVSLKKIVKL